MEGFAVGAIAPVEEELFGLHGCDLLGSGDDKELIDAGSIAVADALKSGFERNRQTQREDCDFGGHGSILLRASPGRITAIPKVCSALPGLKIETGGTRHPAFQA
jgi:hypothetical protein